MNVGGLASCQEITSTFWPDSLLQKLRDDKVLPWYQSCGSELSELETKRRLIKRGSLGGCRVEDFNESSQLEILPQVDFPPMKRSWEVMSQEVADDRNLMWMRRHIDA